MEENLLKLERFAYLVDATFGRLSFPTGEVFYTVERPWLDNRVNVSCIPEAVYGLKLRHSNVVYNSSGGDYRKGWEVRDVPGRTHIMIHPGNWSHNVKGCIAVGLSMQYMPNYLSDFGVTNSRIAFKRIMDLLVSYTEWDLAISSVKAVL